MATTPLTSPTISLTQFLKISAKSLFEGIMTTCYTHTQVDCGMANYNTYLASAVKAIRKADPAAKIAAFCLTSDFGADGTGWLDECIRLRGFKNIDIAGFHPYSSRELGSPVPADLTIETFRKQVRAVADIPLWNTELYYLYDVERGKPEMKQKAHHCAWRFLIDLGEGVGQSPFISSRQIFRNVLVPEFPCSSLFDICLTFLRTCSASGELQSSSQVWRFPTI